jgi:hypothetical protein
MLAELFMLRLEALLRTTARVAVSDARFVPIKLPANTAKLELAKTGEARGG